jgi:hypothetical protein
MTLDALHHRLGHASQDKLLGMISNDKLGGVTLVGKKELSHCYGCSMGK